MGSHRTTRTVRANPYKFVWNEGDRVFTVNAQFLISLFAMCVPPLVLDDDQSLTITVLPLFYYTRGGVRCLGGT